MAAPLPALLASAPPHPRRVVCLTEETTEVLYRIGAGELVVGVSGFTVRPPEARRKPRISSFLTADADRIAALRPDLVLGFSDLQADIARDLVRRGLPVFVMNQRSLAEILQAVRLTAALVGRAEAGERLAEELAAGLARTGTAIEVSGQPERLDLDADAIRAAVERGVMLVLNTDAHAHDQIAGLMRYAVGTARRGGATPESVLNTLDLPALLSWLNRQCQ